MNTGVGCHFLLQGIFLTQGLNPGLPHCRQMPPENLKLQTPAWQAEPPGNLKLQTSNSARSQKCEAPPQTCSSLSLSQLRNCDCYFNQSKPPSYSSEFSLTLHIQSASKSYWLLGYQLCRIWVFRSPLVQVPPLPPAGLPAVSITHSLSPHRSQK